MDKSRKRMAAWLAFKDDPKELAKVYDRIDHGLCPNCGKDPKLDPLGFDPKELQLSGLCDECWNDMFSDDQ